MYREVKINCIIYYYFLSLVNIPSNILLQLLEDGHMTDGLGRKVDFKNCILIMTSNVGARLIEKKTTLGFGMNTESQDYLKMKETI